MAFEGSEAAISTQAPVPPLELPGATIGGLSAKVIASATTPLSIAGGGPAFAVARFDGGNLFADGPLPDVSWTVTATWTYTLFIEIPASMPPMRVMT